jgi:hypothetical protein
MGEGKETLKGGHALDFDGIIHCSRLLPLDLGGLNPLFSPIPSQALVSREALSI